MMNDTTFSGNGKVSFIPVITNTTTQPQTNADRIRAMTDEELAEWVIGIMCKTVKPYMEIREKVLHDNEFYEWLKSQVGVQDG